MTKKTKHKQKQRDTSEIVRTTRASGKSPFLQAAIAFAKNITKWGWQIFGGIALVVGFVAVFYPRISVAPSSSLNPQSALLTPFVISNDGNIPLTDIHYLLGLHKLRFIDGREWLGRDDFNVRFVAPDNFVSKISPGEKYTVLSPLQFNHGGVVAFADVAVIVDFNPYFLPIKIERIYRFITSTGSDGKIYWHAQPLSKTKTELSHLYTK